MTELKRLILNDHDNNYQAAFDHLLNEYVALSVDWEKNVSGGYVRAGIGKMPNRTAKAAIPPVDGAWPDPGA